MNVDEVDLADVDVDADALFDDSRDQHSVLEDLLALVSASTVEDLSDAALKGMKSLNLKKTGSVSHDTKHKSLRERWFTAAPPRPAEDSSSEASSPDEKIIQRNTHVKVEISEGRGASAMKAVEDYRVLGIYTKSYNKWFVCEEGKQQ